MKTDMSRVQKHRIYDQLQQDIEDVIKKTAEHSTAPDTTRESYTHMLEGIEGANEDLACAFAATQEIWSLIKSDDPSDEAARTLYKESLLLARTAIQLAAVARQHTAFKE